MLGAIVGNRIVPGMKRLICFFLGLVAIAGAQSGLYERMTAEERRAAGIENLTPGQQAALDQAAERVAKGEVAQAVETARTETRATVQAEVKAKQRAAVGLTPDKADKDETIRARIPGKFTGWSGRTVFRLDNGQVWVQADASDSRYFPHLENPEVEIAPGIFGSWKLTVVSEGLWVRVKRIK